MKTLVNPSQLAEPTGFTHGVLSPRGRILFLSGQPGLDAHGRITAPGDMVAQFDQALANLVSVIESASGKTSDLVKLNIYVTDRASYVASRRAIGERYRARMGRYYPATTLVQIVDLFDEGALVELDGIAVIED